MKYLDLGLVEGLSGRAFYSSRSFNETDRNCSETANLIPLVKSID